MEKRKYRIGQIAHNLKLEPFVIRFWEKEFDISSERSAGRQRYYTEIDVKKFRLIKDLLHNQGMTIAGAKKYLIQNAIRSKKLVQIKIDFVENFASGNQGEIFYDHIQNLKKKLLQLREIL